MEEPRAFCSQVFSAMYDESAMETYTTPSGLRRYRLPVVYASLQKHRYVSSDTPEFAIHKATLQEMLWDGLSRERNAYKHKKLGFEMNAKRTDLKTRQKLKIAEGRTQIAQQELARSYRVLTVGLGAPSDYDWEFFKKFPEYPFPKPVVPEYPASPPKFQILREPQLTDPDFLPKLETMDKLLHTRRAQKEEDARRRFEALHTQWERLCLQARYKYQQQMETYKGTVETLRNRYQQQVMAWERGKNAYLKEREACVHIVDTKKAAYLEHEPHAVLDYFDMALSHSKYPHYFPHTFDMDYDKDNRILIVNYILPPLRVLPRLARVLYDEDKKLFQELILSDRERDILYARLLHELPLRTFHELFTVDVAVSLAAIHFRGYLFLEEERKAGKPPVCALEIQTDRATFAASDLYHGDPAVIFAEMGGIIRSQE
ncbi:MAG: hypothetical protein BWY09_01818 [Candidatus Hydrogenedentes bacterium ADurb.Bin179]|nr:MAG: hypothetical protein BWY09_01818 [Candidatus Hydrogenedentes bacterium ADurb.Bin179]